MPATTGYVLSQLLLVLSGRLELTRLQIEYEFESTKSQLYLGGLVDY